MATLTLETYSNRASTYYEEQCLEDSEIVKSLPTSTVKFFMPAVTYKLIPPVSTTILSSYKFGNDLESDFFDRNQIVYHTNVTTLLLVIDITNI